jgi:acyl-coenzyme A thioesterase PaaI-like protein
MTLLTTLEALAIDGAEMPLDALPYARHLQLHVRRTTAGLVLRMAYHAALIGSPIPPRLHGGTLGGLLEITSTLAVVLARGPVPEGASAFPKPVNITIDYLRAGGVHDVLAKADILRIGRSIANVRAVAWQEDESRVIASAHMNLLVG